MIVLSRARTVAELIRKMEAAKVLTDGENFTVYAVGEFVTNEGDLAFIRRPGAKVTGVGHKWAEIDLGSEGMVKAYPACDTLDNGEFVIYKN